MHSCTIIPNNRYFILFTQHFKKHEGIVARFVSLLHIEFINLANVHMTKMTRVKHEYVSILIESMFAC